MSKNQQRAEALENRLLDLFLEREAARVASLVKCSKDDTDGYFDLNTVAQELFVDFGEDLRERFVKHVTTRLQNGNPSKPLHTEAEWLAGVARDNQDAAAAAGDVEAEHDWHSVAFGLEESSF